MSTNDYAKLVQNLQQTIQGLESAIQAMSETLQALRADLAKGDAEATDLRRMLFGSRREKLPPKERGVAKGRPNAAGKMP